MLRSLIASRASAKCYCVISSCWGRTFQCNFSAERVRREATEWLDKGSWPLVRVWAVFGAYRVTGGSLIQLAYMWVAGLAEPRCECLFSCLGWNSVQHCSWGISRISNVVSLLLCSEMVVPVWHRWILFLHFQTICLLWTICLHCCS